MSQLSRVLLAPAVLAIALSMGCATTTKVGAAASLISTAVTSAQTKTYDWGKILPPVPIAGSAQDQADMAAVRQAQSLQGGARWTQAADDAPLLIYGIYGSVLGSDFTLAKRPEIGALMAYAGRQFSQASNDAKAIYTRPRPFVTDPSLAVCTAEKPGGFSYPSGHAGWGWLSALILARLEPQAGEAILARGLDYGQSRVVCGVHYPSDLMAGRILADAVLVTLEQDPTYQRLFAEAKGAKH
jgi:acid phosphatase (class A)